MATNNRKPFDPEWIESLRATERALGTPESEIRSLSDRDLVMAEEERLNVRHCQLKLDRLRIEERRLGLSELELRHIDDSELLARDQYRHQRSDFWLGRVPDYVAGAAVTWVAFQAGSKFGDLLSFAWTKVGAGICLCAAMLSFFASPPINENDRRFNRVCAAAWVALTALGIGFIRPEPTRCASLPHHERAACIEELNQEANDLQDLDRENERRAP